MFICSVCNKNFKSHYSLNAHKKIHSMCIRKTPILCCSLLTKKETPVHLLNNHEIRWKKTNISINCKNCNVEFTCKNNSTKKVFCSRSCSVSYNNKNHSETRKFGPAKKIKENYPKTTVYLNTCAKTGKIFYYPSYRKYHPTIQDDLKIYRYNCSFRFSISQFPMWFNGNIIEKHGWYSTPGKCKNGIFNINGVSRDHNISIIDGFNNGIDSWYLSHPANCSLILHSENIKKGKSSSNNLDILKLKILQFEKIYPDYIHL